MFAEVSVVIPGAKNPQQAADNAAAAALAPLPAATMARVHEVYDRYLRPRVHQRW